MSPDRPRFFHLHLISDSTGETLTAIARAASVQYSKVTPVEHVHPLVRMKKQLDRCLQNVDATPGIVLYTIVSRELSAELEKRCLDLNVPCIPVLDPVMKAFESYLGAPSSPNVGGQHILNADYFRRIEAMNFSMVHDDGQLPEDLGEADMVLVGISRTSKTPTCIYLANRGYKTTNLPLVPDIPVPQRLIDHSSKTFIVGLIASPERIAQIRRNRLESLGGEQLDDYVDKDMIGMEIAYTRKLCGQQGWPIIDVSRRSIEETAAAIIKLYQDRDEADL